MAEYQVFWNKIVCSKWYLYSELKEALFTFTEWTLVQLTSQHNLNEALEVKNEKIHTNPLFITVFKCGQNDHQPLLFNLGVPKDISGTLIPFQQEMYNILKFRKDRLEGKINKRLVGVHYREIDDRLKVWNCYTFWVTAFGFYPVLFVAFRQWSPEQVVRIFSLLFCRQT